MSRVIVTVEMELDRDATDSLPAYDYPGSRVLTAKDWDEVLVAMAQEDIEGASQGEMTFDELGVEGIKFLGGRVVR